MTGMTSDGTNGLTFPDGTLMGTGNSLANRNRIINGGFKVDQRNAGAAQTITAAAALAYTVDRWFAWCTGQNVTGQQVAGVAVTGLQTPQNAYKFTAGGTGPSLVGYATRLEAVNTYDLATSPIMLSVSMVASTAVTITWYVDYANSADTFGTIASPTITNISTGTFAVTTTATRFSIPSIAAASMASATTGIQIRLVANSGMANSATWTIQDAQFEPGVVASPQERRQYGTELALCQRYYEQLPMTVVTNASPYFNSAWYKVPKRAQPTVTTAGSLGGAIIGSQGTYTTAGTLGLIQFSPASGFGDILNTAVSEL